MGNEIRMPVNALILSTLQPDRHVLNCVAEHWSFHQFNSIRDFIEIIFRTQQQNRVGTRDIFDAHTHPHTHTLTLTQGVLCFLHFAEMAFVFKMRKRIHQNSLLLNKYD